MNILIQNGRVLDPSTNTDQKLDILITDGVIKERAESISADADKVIDERSLDKIGDKLKEIYSIVYNK